METLNQFKSTEVQANHCSYGLYHIIFVSVFLHAEVSYELFDDS